jgi:hypothetical protein
VTEATVQLFPPSVVVAIGPVLPEMVVAVVQSPTPQHDMASVIPLSGLHPRFLDIGAAAQVAPLFDDVTIIIPLVVGEEICAAANAIQ